MSTKQIETKNHRLSLSGAIRKRRVRVPVALALLLAHVAPVWGTVFFTQPGGGGGTAFPTPPTRLFAMDEVGSGVSLIGFVTVDGTDVAVEAIALDSHGNLYGFTYDPNVGSMLILINTQDASAITVGAGTPIFEHISGAAFDRDDNLWVFDVGNKTIDRFDISTLSLAGMPFPIPLPSTTNGGDLAFALDGTCYFIGTKTDNSDQPLYTCDVNSGVFTLVGDVTSSGFVDNPPDVFSPAGIAWSLNPTTCEPALIVSDGRFEDEIGILDLSTLHITGSATTGVNISFWNHPDLAGFPSIAQVPVCDHCGDGVLDPGEECDDGNTIDGDGCSSVCLLEPNQPPVAVCSPASIVVECTGPDGADVTLDGSGSFDPDPSDVVLFHWDVSNQEVVLDNIESPTPTGTFPIGVTMATLTVADGNGGVATCDVLVTVQDTTPPEVMCTTNVASLWPPNHTMREVTVFVTTSDVCETPDPDLLPLIVTVRSDEPDDSTGDGETIGDVNGEDGFIGPVDVTLDFTFDTSVGPDGAWVATILLRAERDGSGDGRAYTIDVLALDTSSNLSTTSCVVVVPHDRRGGGGGGN